MNQWTVLCIAAALSNGILRSGDIAQPMELITSKTRTVLNLCPVELLCVMTVLFCVLRQLGPGLGAGTGCARVLAPSWARHQAGPGVASSCGPLPTVSSYRQLSNPQPFITGCQQENEETVTQGGNQSALMTRWETFLRTVTGSGQTWSLGSRDQTYYETSKYASHHAHDPVAGSRLTLASTWSFVRLSNTSMKQ